MESFIPVSSGGRALASFVLIAGALFVIQPYSLFDGQGHPYSWCALSTPRMGETQRPFAAIGSVGAATNDRLDASNDCRSLNVWVVSGIGAFLVLLLS